MTNVFIHGKLAKEYGKKFKFSLGSPKDVFWAIEANKPGFLNRVLELDKKGAHYSLILDGKPATEMNVRSGKVKEIHIVPAIIGSAGTAAALGAIALVGGAYAGTLGGTWLVVGAVLTAVGSAALSFGISNLLQKDQKTDAGSASSRANALNKSFLFSNGENITEQGSPVPIGYGRLRVGSAVIQSTIKSFPARFNEQNSLPVYSEFTEFATKKGNQNLAIFDNQQEIQTS